jgi:hypothetical protein
MPVSTGHHKFDTLTGTGGFPCGITELSGTRMANQAPKLAWDAAQGVLEAGGKVAIIDIGLDFFDKPPTGTFYHKPKGAGEALELCRLHVETGEFRLVILGSIPSMIQISRGPIRIPQRLSKTIPLINKPAVRTNTSVLVLNEVRDGSGESAQTFGGNALAYYSVLRVIATPGAASRVHLEMIKTRFGKNFQKISLH